MNNTYQNLKGKISLDWGAEVRIFYVLYSSLHIVNVRQCYVGGIQICEYGYDSDEESWVPSVWVNHLLAGLTVLRLNSALRPSQPVLRGGLTTMDGLCDLCKRRVLVKMWRITAAVVLLNTHTLAAWKWTAFHPWIETWRLQLNMTCTLQVQTLTIMMFQILVSQPLTCSHSKPLQTSRIPHLIFRYM